MSKRKTYFKIVSVASSGALISYNVSNEARSKFTAPTPLVLEYKVDEATKPMLEGSKLFAFETKANATEFGFGAGAELWECEVENPSQARYYITAPWGGDDIYEFWRKVKNGGVGSKVRGYEGTIWGDAITLIRKVS